MKPSNKKKKIFINTILQVFDFENIPLIVIIIYYIIIVDNITIPT